MNDHISWPEDRHTVIGNGDDDVTAPQRAYIGNREKVLRSQAAEVKKTLIGLQQNQYG